MDKNNIEVSSTVPANYATPSIDNVLPSNSDNINDLRQRKKKITKKEEEKSPEKEVPLLVKQGNKWKDFVKRGISSLALLLGFTFVIYAGHAYIVLTVLAIQIVTFKEVLRLGFVLRRERKLFGFWILPWLCLAATLFYLYGVPILSRSTFIMEKFSLIWDLIRYHNFISFSIYVSAFVFFVISLRKGMYQYQFTRLAWTIVTIVLIVIQSNFIVYNIFEGLIWFILPVSMIICNDMMAYFFGFFFGRTPLIQLSPKKTWEGFIGATFSTMIWAFFFSRLLSQFDYMICPKTDFSSQVTLCRHDDIFTLVPYKLPSDLVDIMSRFDLKGYILIAPIQFHSLVMALFASLVAPFGGFFASGVKRAFNLKDFGDTIPGHGGLTDRMDCQFLMGLFTYVYINSFLRRGTFDDVSTLLFKIAALPADEQLSLAEKLQEHLISRALKHS